MLRLARKHSDKNSSKSIIASPSQCLSMFSAFTIRDDQSWFPTSLLPNDFVDTTKIFEGSQITVSDASTITDLFCSRYNLSDDCSTDLHSLIKNLLPVSNNFPTGYSFIKKVKTNFVNSIRILEKCSENSYCILNFRFQIGDIIKRHFFLSSQYSNFRESDGEKDFTTIFCPIFKTNHLPEKLPPSTWYSLLMAWTWKSLLSKKRSGHFGSRLLNTAKATNSSSCWLFSPKLGKFGTSYWSRFVFWTAGWN